MVNIDEWLAGTTGSYIVYAPPLSGMTPFVDEVGRGRDGETLLVAATRGLDRTPRTTLGSVSSFVDCTPTESERTASVGSPGDLTGVSMPVSEFLRAADEPMLAVDSVSTLLYYAEEATVFRFLSVLTAHIGRSDGLGLFVMTPAAHDEQTVHTFEQAFDGRIDLEADRLRVQAPDDPDAPDGWQSR